MVVSPRRLIDQARRRRVARAFGRPSHRPPVTSDRPPVNKYGPPAWLWAVFAVCVLAGAIVASDWPQLRSIADHVAAPSEWSVTQTTPSPTVPPAQDSPRLAVVAPSTPASRPPAAPPEVIYSSPPPRPVAIASPTPAPPAPESTTIPLETERGTFVVPVLINDAITLKFTVDSGAAVSAFRPML
jgi:hypothetical protein